MENKFTKITIHNKGNYIFNYYKTKSKNIFIVKNDIGKITIKGKDFHCNYNFTLQLNPLVPNIDVNFNPKTCKVNLGSQLQQLVLQDNSNLYQKTNNTIKISNFSGFIYAGLFLFFFIFSLFFLIRKYVKEDKFINYKG